jgi:cell division protein ZapA
MEPDEPSRVVHVEIHGQQYPIRSGLDPAYVAELAAFVDQKMRAASRETPAGDTLKIAVLAALNIADECFRIRDDEATGARRSPHAPGELERMLDLALGSTRGRIAPGQPAGTAFSPAERPALR